MKTYKRSVTTKKYKRVYYDPSHPASFGGVDRLWRSVGGSKKDVEEWLQTQDTYTLHKQARKKYKRNRIEVAGLDDQWSADLVDVRGLAKYNNQYTFLLTCIDVLSKYAWVVPLKDKSSASVIKAFKSIFKSRKPRKIRTDRGKEFVNQSFQRFLKANDVQYLMAINDPKASVVERFNRSLRARMWRYFTAKDTDKYIHVLQKIVEAYNATKHSAHGYAPKDINVMNAETTNATQQSQEDL